MNDHVLRVENLTKSYTRGPETVWAVNDVTAVFKRRSVSLIVGPSGSGKTTLLNLLVGWERPETGSIFWLGEETDPSGLLWNDLAVVPQRLGLLEELSVSENIGLADRVAANKPEPSNLLATLDLEDLADALPGELSQGQQQRVAVARAIAANPAAVVFDEPTSSQDEEHARQVLEAIRSLAAGGATCIVASHDPIAPEYADSILVMRDGEISAD